MTKILRQPLRPILISLTATLLASCLSNHGPLTNRSENLAPDLDQATLDKELHRLDESNTDGNQSQSPQNLTPLGTDEQLVDSSEDQVTEEPGDELSEPGEEAPKNLGPTLSQSDGPIDLNTEVKKWIQYFTARDRDRFQRFIDRGAKYKPMIEKVLAEHGVPKELYYQAMIESGFSTMAKSSASAVGIWQFIRPTGVRYGLKVTNWLDERRDPMRSTRQLPATYQIFTACINPGTLPWRPITQVKAESCEPSWRAIAEIFGALPKKERFLRKQ